MKPDLLDMTLLQSTGLYAAFLEAANHREEFEPDWTWLEAAFGVQLILLAVAARVRTQKDPTWQDYEAAVLRGLFVGGLPIVGWQLWQGRRRLLRVLDAFQRDFNEQQSQALAKRGGELPPAIHPGRRSYFGSGGRGRPGGEAQSYAGAQAHRGHQNTGGTHPELDDRSEDREVGFGGLYG
jgi:hypothetical protein